MKKILGWLSIGEWVLWLVSVVAIVLSFVLFGGGDYLTLVASLIGVTSLIFNAKGNPVGQALMVVFSIMYAIVSLMFRYYGEMLTYLGMTMPMSVIALVSWLKHPYKGNKSQVEVNVISAKEWLFMFGLTAVVTFGFYFVLDAFDTANIVPSTISVATSFVAVYLTFRRSHFYALGYAANDVVLIVLWTMASLQNAVYWSVVVCFVAFLINDLYGFLSWQKMKKRQTTNSDC